MLQEEWQMATKFGNCNFKQNIHEIIYKIFCFCFVDLHFVYIACKNETSCEGCRDSNKPPIALAGSDQVITLPTDSVSLDGRSSSDPDGTISEWLWSKISGPASFIIANANSVQTQVTNLVL